MIDQCKLSGGGSLKTSAAPAVRVKSLIHRSSCALVQDHSGRPYLIQRDNCGLTTQKRSQLARMFLKQEKASEALAERLRRLR